MRRRRGNALHAGSQGGRSQLGGGERFPPGRQPDGRGLERTPFEKLQQFIYDGDDRNIIARYVDGELVVSS